MKKILTVSLVAMMAISAARAEIASTAYVQGAVNAEKGLREEADLAINTKIGTVTEGKDVVTMISDAQTAAEAKVTALQTGQVKTNTDAIVAINEDLKSVATNEAVQGIQDTLETYGDIVTHNVSEFATAAQGLEAESAVQQSEVTTGSVDGTISVQGTDVAVKGLGSAAYTASTAYDAAGAAAAVEDNLNAYKTEMTTTLAGKQDKALVTAITDGMDKATSYPSVSLLETVVNNKTTQLVTGLGDVDSLATEAEDVVSAINEVKATADAAVEIDQGATNKDKAVITNATGQITTGTISSGMITDNTIVDADIAANAQIAQTKIAGLADSLSAATAAALSQLADETEDKNNEGVYTLTMKVLGDETTFKWEKIAR